MSFDDVSLDTVLTAMKLALALLITFVLREYVPSDRMSTETFLYRLLTTRGRRELTKHRERIVFYLNPRDPRTNAALAEACDQFNRRGLVRDKRELRFALEERAPCENSGGLFTSRDPHRRSAPKPLSVIRFSIRFFLNSLTCLSSTIRPSSGTDHRTSRQHGNR